jgi:HD superfamily phosphohydrolase
MEPWGLSADDRRLRPWDLAPELLAPRKVTTDELHGDIHTSVLEQALIDTTPFQRLRRVRQLGSAHLVYPGATHTRFAHSLGALRVVQDLLRNVLRQGDGLHPVPDLIEQWRTHSAGYSSRRGAEAVVLGRLGALLHDLCHVPFGHSVEDDLQVLVSHDENSARFDVLWVTVLKELPAQLDRHLPGDVKGLARARARSSARQALSPGAALYQQLRPMIVSKDEAAMQLRSEGLTYPFVDDLVGNTICADLLDYLLRDHRNTGLPASLGTRFTSAFFVVPEGRGPFSRRAALALMRDRHERTDVVSELLKALRYRYELSERVLYHHGKLVADAMIGRALDCWSKAVWLEAAADRIVRLDRAEDLVEQRDLRELQRQVGALVDRRRRAKPVRDTGARHEDPVWSTVRERLETEFLNHGDDSLIDRVCGLDNDPVPSGLVGPLVRDFRQYAASLMRDYRDRRLFRIAGRVGVREAPAAELYNRFKDAEQRVALEEAAQGFAEVGTEPSVIIWLPDPKMRIKLAGVLVDDGDHIDRFNAYEDARGRRGDDIYRAHRNLWGLWVYTRRDMSDEDQDAVLVYLAHRLGVAWEQRREVFGDEPSTWLPRYGLHRVLSMNPRHPTIERLLPEVGQISARGSRDEPADFATVEDLCSALVGLESVREAQSKRDRRSGANRKGD